jgi:Na+/H+-dicarboxylate symporter
MSFQQMIVRGAIHMKLNRFLKNNWFFLSMILGIVLGIAVGFTWPNAGVLEPLGTLFIQCNFH